MSRGQIPQPTSGLHHHHGLQQPQQQHQQQQRSIIEIYTDWANHYLDKLPKKHKIKDLKTEVSDGVILAEVIEAVVGAKVPDISKKPKASQALTNVEKCLTFLNRKGVGITDISAKDIRDGNLKAILGLFFQLSRFKQQQKQLQRGQLEASRSSTPRIPSVPSSPAKCSGSVKANGNNSPNKSLIARMGGRQVSASALRPPTKSSPIKQKQGDQSKSGIPSKSGSMLERFKLKRAGTSAGPTFTQPTQGETQIPQGPPGVRCQYQQSPPAHGLGKRTSSSSGFSSARSVNSESSSAMSVCSDSNFPSPSALRRINENSTFKASPSPTSIPAASPKRFANAKGSHTPKGGNSPKRSPKFQRSNTEIKDYGLIDSPSGGSGFGFPPHAVGKMSRMASQMSRIPHPGSIMKQSPVGGGSRAEETHKKTSHYQEPNGLEAEGLVATKGATDTEDGGTPTSVCTRTCSLPRQKRRDQEGSPGPPNVAVVSPMPSLKKGMSLDSAAAVMAAASASTSLKDKEKGHGLDEEDEEDEEETTSSLKGLVPMKPIFGDDSKASPVKEESKYAALRSLLVHSASVSGIQQKRAHKTSGSQP